MNEKIAELIFRYVKEPLNDNFINDLVNLVITEECLGDFITKEKIDLISLRDITMYEKQFAKNQFKKYVPAKDYSKEYYNYIYVTRLVLKELELIKLKKQYAEESIASKVIKLSLGCQGKQNKSIINNKSLFQFAPELRNASISSHERIDTISTLLNEDAINKVNLVEFIDTLTCPYQFLEVATIQAKSKQTSPTLFYLEQMGCKIKKIREIDKENKKTNIKTKLLNGFTVEEKIIDDSLRLQRELKHSLEK